MFINIFSTVCILHYTVYILLFSLYVLPYIYLLTVTDRGNSIVITGIVSPDNGWDKGETMDGIVKGCQVSSASTVKPETISNYCPLWPSGYGCCHSDGLYLLCPPFFRNGGHVIFRRCPQHFETVSTTGRRGFSVLT